MRIALASSKRSFVALAVIAVASLYASQTHALPCGRETDRLFYDNCGPGPHNIVGEIYTDCDGNTSSWGVTSDFEERDITNCCTGVTRVTFYECGSPVTNFNICLC